VTLVGENKEKANTIHPPLCFSHLHRLCWWWCGGGDEEIEVSGESDGTLGSYDSSQLGKQGNNPRFRTTNAVMGKKAGMDVIFLFSDMTRAMIS